VQMTCLTSEMLQPRIHSRYPSPPDVRHEGRGPPPPPPSSVFSMGCVREHLRQQCGRERRDWGWQRLGFAFALSRPRADDGSPTKGVVLFGFCGVPIGYTQRYLTDRLCVNLLSIYTHVAKSTNHFENHLTCIKCMWN
jgi:hypothetical protein